MKIGKVNGIKENFAKKNYISHENMKMIQGVRGLIMGHLKKTEFVVERNAGARNLAELNINSSRWDVVKACLTAGMYPNLAQVSNGEILSTKKDKLLAHKGSILRDNVDIVDSILPQLEKIPASWVVYDEKSG